MLKNGSAYKEIFRLKKGDTVPVFYGKDKQLYRINPENLVGGLDERLKILENNEYKVTYFEIIDASAGTSGSFSLPTNTTLYENSWEGNAFLSTINGDSYPDGKTPKESDGTPISANINVLGGTANWSGTNTYADPIAIIFQLTVLGKDLNNLNIDNVLDFYNTDIKYDNIKMFGEDFVGNGSSVFTLTGAVSNATFVEGSWDVANIIPIAEVYIFPAYTGMGRAIYNKQLNESEDPNFEKIFAVFQVGGVITFTDAPIIGEPFTIWYGYNLKDEDNLGNTYYKQDTTAPQEAGYPYVQERFKVRPLALNVDLNSADANITRAVVGGRTTWTITHPFATRDLRVELMSLGGNYDTQFLNIRRPTINTVEVEAMGNIANNSFRASIKV